MWPPTDDHLARLRETLAWVIARSPYYQRLFAEHGSFLYVNRGVGVAGPAIRLNCAREIATIELV